MMQFACPHCGAEYGTDQVAPGTTFTCGACNQTLTAPAAPPAAAPPAAAPMPSAPKRTAPVRKAPAPAKSGGPNKGVLIGGVVVAVVAVIGLAIAFGGNGDGGDQPKEKPDPLIPARAFITEVEGRHDVRTAQGAWDAMTELEHRASAWRKQDKDREAISALDRKAIELKTATLKLDTNFAPARERRGERRYQDELLRFAQAEFLQSADKILAQRAHDKLKRLTRKGNGWGKKALFEEADALVARLEPMLSARAELEGSAFGKAAKALEAPTLADLDERFKDWAEDGKWPGAVMRIKKPFVFFVQKDDSWDPQNVANSRARELAALQDIIMAEFKDDLDLKPVEVPVPVLMFRSYKMYQKYSGAIGAYAHFEPTTGRMAVHDACSHTTIMHEGTHQLMWFWRKGGPTKLFDAGNRTYWFNEGIAEWYSGAARRRNADNTGWEYEIGRLQMERASNLSRYMTKNDCKTLFNLRELIQTRYHHRAKIRRTHREGHIYSQGWFLIYFLNHFNVDAEGNVVLGKKGKYSDRWRKYVKGELEDKGGLEDFMKAMELDDASFKQLETEFWRYAAWINKKLNLKAVKNGQVIPWQEQEVRGRKVGAKRDDVLSEVAADVHPPVDRDTIGGKDEIK